MRGEHLNLGEKVNPGTPSVLPPMQPMQGEGEADRLALANWLVSPNHPLTARVAVILPTLGVEIWSFGKVKCRVGRGTILEVVPRIGNAVSRSDTSTFFLTSLLQRKKARKTPDSSK